MDWDVVWTAAALGDVEAAVRYLARRNSPEAAESLRAALFASVDLLGANPQLAAIAEDDPSGRTREVSCRQYRVFYQLRLSLRRVEVVLVWHSARGTPPLG